MNMRWMRDWHRVRSCNDALMRRLYDIVMVHRAQCSGKYLELFGRKNNLRNHWVTVGNEVTGTGLPLEDQQALHATRCIPGAVYGARHRTKL